MDKKAIYDKYLQAINNSDFAILTNIASNIGNINLISLEVNANWDSSVKEAVDSKINDLKTKIAIITSEQSNLNNIVSKSKELKTKIEEYNKVYSNIRNLSQPTLQNNATEEQIKTYNEKVKEFNQDQQYKSTLNKLVSEIETLVNNIKSINFNTSNQSGKITLTQPFRGPVKRTTGEGPNKFAYINPEGVLALRSVNDYNNYWRTQLEDPVSNKLAVLEMSNENTEASIEISNSILEYSNNDVAKALAQLALTREGGLFEMQESTALSIDQYKKLYEIYKAANHNGNNSDPNNMDGPVRLLAYQEQQEINGKKPSILEQSMLIQAGSSKFLDNQTNFNIESDRISQSYDDKKTAAIQEINSKIDSLDLSINNDRLNPYALNPQQVGVFEGSEVFTKPSTESRETIAYSMFAQAIHAETTPGAFPMVGTSLTEIKGDGGKVIGYELSKNGPDGYEQHKLYLPEGDSGTYRLELDSNK